MNRIILIFTVLAALVPTAMSNVSAPSAAYSQVAELNNISTSTQCLDFNQDGICESIVLVNGTVINTTATQTPVSTQCLDFNQDGTCESSGWNL